MVEFQSPEQIRNAYPNGVLDLQDGGTFQTLAGQPTDDSEMAILLARTIVDTGTYDADTAYSYWLSIRPFDCGNIIRRGIRGDHNLESQANGAMMRISSLGIFGAAHDLVDVRNWAMEDSRLTHSNQIWQDANALYTMGIATAIRQPLR